MTALAKDTPRTFLKMEANGSYIVNGPLEASKVVYRGAAIGLDSSDQAWQPLEDGDVFVGIAIESKTGGTSDGDETIGVAVGGVVKLPITSVAQADVGKAVAATDDATYTLTTSGNALVGRIIHVPATGTAYVMLKTPGENLIGAQAATAHT